MTVVLALAGLYLSVYFALVAYRRIQPDVAWVPAVCRLDERSCGSIVFTRYGRVFLVPNGVWGALWYAALLACEVFGWTAALRPALLAASAVTVGLAVYLMWALERRLGVFCALCYAAHGINALVFLRLV